MARRPISWLFGIVLVVLASLIASTLTGIPKQALNVNAVKDSIRYGPDIVVTARQFDSDSDGFRQVFAEQDAVTPALAQEIVDPRQLNTQDSDGAPQIDKTLHARGAVNLRLQRVRVVLQGNRNPQIRILNVRPVIQRRTAPLSGVFMDIPSQGEDQDIPLEYGLDRLIPRQPSCTRQAGAECSGIDLVPQTPAGLIVSL